MAAAVATAGAGIDDNALETALSALRSDVRGLCVQLQRGRCEFAVSLRALARDLREAFSQSAESSPCELSEALDTTLRLPVRQSWADTTQSPGTELSTSSAKLFAERMCDHGQDGQRAAELAIKAQAPDPAICSCVADRAEQCQRSDEFAVTLPSVGAEAVHGTWDLCGSLAGTFAKKPSKKDPAVGVDFGSASAPSASSLQRRGRPARGTSAALSEALAVSLKLSSGPIERPPWALSDCLPEMGNSAMEATLASPGHQSCDFTISLHSDPGSARSRGSGNPGSARVRHGNGAGRTSEMVSLDSESSDSGSEDEKRCGGRGTIRNATADNGLHQITAQDTEIGPQVLDPSIKGQLGKGKDFKCHNGFLAESKGGDFDDVFLDLTGLEFAGPFGISSQKAKAVAVSSTASLYLASGGEEAAASAACDPDLGSDSTDSFDMDEDKEWTERLREVEANVVSEGLFRSSALRESVRLTRIEEETLDSDEESA